jgi:hypothetical protein
MGAWGTALYSDDLAADLRGEFRDLIGDGLTADAALERLESRFASSLQDPEEAPVFWLSIAHTAWKIGRPIERATNEALRAISAGLDLKRWPDEADRSKRAAVLERVEADLRSTPKPPTRIPKRIVAANDWRIGEIIGYRLASGAWTLFRVVGHHQDRGGRHAVCEPLDWVGRDLPSPTKITGLSARQPTSQWRAPQFMMAEPRKHKDAERLLRTGATSPPMQRPGRYVVFGFPYLDRQFLEQFGLK